MLKTMNLLAVLLFAAAVPAIPSQPPAIPQIAPGDDHQNVEQPSGGPPTTTSKQAIDKKICRSLPSSSSRLPNRACLTAKQWQQVEDEVSN